MGQGEWVNLSVGSRGKTAAAYEVRKPNTQGLISRTEGRLHGCHKINDAGVGNFVENKVCILTKADDFFISQDAQVLGNVGVGGFDFVSDLANCHLSVL